MSADPLFDLAHAAGLEVDWEDAHGQPRRVEPDALRAILAALGHESDDAAACRRSLERFSQAQEPALRVLDVGSPFTVATGAATARFVAEDGRTEEVRLDPKGGLARLNTPDAPGYYSLELRDRTLTLAACPARCLTPRDRLSRRGWGLTVQVYALGGPGAFGDFGDLARFARAAGADGADALAISPTHALFGAAPERYSPYSPSSRDWLNPLLADAGPCAAAGAEAEPLIDWRAAAPAKVARLRHRLETMRDDPRRAAFVAAGGERLRRHALFEALDGHFRTRGLDSWRTWPVEAKDPVRAEAAAMAIGLGPEIEFHLALQWLAELSLEQAQDAARAAGMTIGLIADLAVGLDPAGSHAWSAPDELLTGLSLGAPPDAFQAAGQGWGVTTFAPEALKRNGYAPFLRTLRAALRHTGGVRIDHVLGLKRLWVLPDGATPLQGAYLRAPFDDVLRLLALESHRAGAVIVGEDLGVVPPGLRDALAERGVLGMRVLPFERERSGGFHSPQRWSECAVAMTTTHDLPPVAGWWRGCDLAWRARVAPEFDQAAETVARAADRTLLWRALTDAGVAEGREPAPTDCDPVVDAAIAMTNLAPCELALTPVEDLLGLTDQVNMPGVVERHPNWCRRLPLEAEALFAAAPVRRRLKAIKAERPK